jgi:hypothetical protein
MAPAHVHQIYPILRQRLSLLSKVFKPAMLNIPAALVLFLLFSACGNPAKEMPAPPANVLNEGEMKQLITDIALAESIVNMNLKNVPAASLDSVYFFEPMIHHKVRKTQFDSSVQFYIRYPAVYKKIYDEVLASLSAVQAHRDSIRNSKIKK